MAAIVIVSMKRMIQSLADLKRFGKRSLVEGALWFLTFTCTVFIDLDVGLGVGIGLSILVLFFQGIFPGVVNAVETEYGDIFLNEEFGKVSAYAGYIRTSIQSINQSIYLRLDPY